MARRRVVYIGGPIGRILAWRYMNACLLLLICALSVGIVISALNRAGNWPPAFMRAYPTVAITGPGTSQHIEGYALGAVVRPGAYSLHSGARVRELVEAAGGVLDNADITRVDLAALLADGQAIYVPRLGEQVPLQLGASHVAAGAQTPQTAQR